jgi:hypothetical protein
MAFRDMHLSLLRLINCELKVLKCKHGGSGPADSESALTTHSQGASRAAEAVTAALGSVPVLTHSVLVSDVHSRLCSALLEGVKALFRHLCDPSVLEAVSVEALHGSAALAALRKSEQW